ncbi:MAG TPA: ATP-binding protein [Sandaracinaceae bacterium]
MTLDERRTDRLLASVADILATTCEPMPILERFCRLVVPEFADACLVFEPEQGGARLSAHAHADPQHHARTEALYARYPVRAGRPTPVLEVMTSGEPHLCTRVAAEELAAMSRGTAYLAVVRAAGIESALFVPLAGNGGVLGVMSWVSHRPELRYDDGDVARAGALARIAALAVEGARARAELRAANRALEALAEERRRAEETAREASRRKDEFLAMLGHELRNPLAPILTAVELMKLEGGAAGEPARAVIERQAKHLVCLVDDLLDLSRITRGRIELALENVELWDVVSAAIERTSPLLEEQAHVLTVDVPRSGLTVRADPVRLAQVLENLLSNSAKYTPPCGRIAVRARRDGDAIVIEVEDDGAGIPPPLLPQLFAPFVQGERTIERAQGGLGIGLSLVHALVSLHGGSVEAHSEGPGKGTRMTVRLPAPRSTVPPQSFADPAGDAAATGRRVLVVDDNVDAAEMLALLLRRRGHSVEVAHDGPSALEAYERFRPEVALLDIGLPVMDGYDLARRLRARAEGNILLVAVTGYGQEADRQRSAEVGFSHHLVKPVSTRQLLAILAR